MAEQVEQEHAAQAVKDDDEDDGTPGYKAPAYKSVNELVSQDQDDESLVKYKKALLGDGDKIKGPFPEDPRNVIVTKMSLVLEDRDDIEVDLTQPLEAIKKTQITLKEGIKYRIKITFYIQKDIVSGLRYLHKVSRKSIRVDKCNYMVGSFGPKMEMNTYTSEEDEAPSGLLARGDYKVESKFIDDDKMEHLVWDWQFSIKKDWD